MCTLRQVEYSAFKTVNGIKYLTEKPKIGLFHKWTEVTNDDGNLTSFAIVEDKETGQVYLAVADSLKFLN